MFKKYIGQRWRLLVGCFRCKACGAEQMLEQTKNVLTAPTDCVNGCDVTAQGFEIDLEKSTFEDVPHFCVSTLEELKKGQ